MKIYSDVIKIIANIIFLITIAITSVAIFHDNGANEAPIGSFETAVFNDGWILEKDGETKEISFPYSGPNFFNKEVVLKNTLPDYVKEGMSLNFRSDLSDVKIYVDGELRVDYGEDTVGFVGYYPPSAYEIVPLKENDAKKEIRIELLTKKSTSKFENVTIGFGNNSWFMIIKNNVVRFSLAILMVVAGFVAAVFYTIVSRKIKINRSILYLSQTIMMMGVWTISESKLRQLIFNTSSLTQIFCYLSLEILVVYVIFYFDEIQNNRYHKTYLVLETINLAQLIINVILSVLRIADFHDTLRYSHVCVVIALVSTVICLLMDIVSARIKKYNISAIGMFAFLMATVTEIISYYVTSAQTLGVFLCIGLLALLAATIAQTLVDAYKAEIESRQHVEKATMTTFETIASAIDARDEYTGGHSARVAYYASLLAKKMAKELDYSEEDIKRIHYIALMHDIGKIGIPDAILNKASKLTDEEFVIMKQHAVIGDRLLKDIDTVEGLSDGVRHHHERYDGKGYPDQLAKDEIPVVAKILCIADCFDAMTSNRVYRKRLSDEQVRMELERCAGTQFDPHFIEKFCELLDSGELIVQTQKGNLADYK